MNKYLRPPLLIACITLSLLSALVNGEEQPNPSVDRRQIKIKPYLELKSYYGIGFFEQFLIAIAALQLYEEGEFAGVHIDYETSGTYYDKEHGPNWWSYYFEPVKVGNKQKAYLLKTYNASELKIDLPRHAEFTIPRSRANKLISKYIEVKTHVQQKVDAIVADLFGQGKVIGVHYRGTDKYTEDPLAPYELVVSHIEAAIIHFTSLNEEKDLRIFVATDQQDFLEYIKTIYPSMIICYADAIRSIDDSPVHLSNISTSYKKGEDALIDCLLLSKCDYLIKTSSNLSLCAAYFNPEMPMIHATSRHWHAPLE